MADQRCGTCRFSEVVNGTPFLWCLSDEASREHRPGEQLRRIYDGKDCPAYQPEETTDDE